MKSFSQVVSVFLRGHDFKSLGLSKSYKKSEDRSEYKQN